MHSLQDLTLTPDFDKYKLTLTKALIWDKKKKK